MRADKIVFKFYVLLTLPLLMIVAAFLLETPENMIKGLKAIVLHSDVLLVDYLAVGGIGATLINSALLTLANVYLLYRLKIEPTGPIIAAVLTIAGFAFMGKNIINVWPIYVGGYLYTRYKGTSFKSVILIMMFATTLAPLVTELLISPSLGKFGFIAGFLGGVIVGFIMPPLSAHMLRVHDGYNLYNIGFTGGLLGGVLMAVKRGLGIEPEKQFILSSEYDLELKILLTAFFLFLLFLGVYLNGRSFRGYRRIMKLNGRIVTDFVQLEGFEVSLINMGIMGLMGLAVVALAKSPVNGPVVAGLLTLVGFSAFGKHPFNSLPVILGIFLGEILIFKNIHPTVLAITALFGTTLAPIAGSFGALAGIAAGMLHMFVVLNVGYLHGGINLYNNGFSGGIVATILVPILRAFGKEA
ncbi:DUF1576 domain-containing protein [Thermococcus sp.]